MERVSWVVRTVWVAALPALATTSACTDFDGLSLPREDGVLDATTVDSGHVVDGEVEEGVAETGAGDVLATCSGTGLHPRAANGHCYRWSSATAAWATAESDCIVWGGHLVSVADEDEHVFVTLVLDQETSRVGFDGGAPPGAWIGLNDANTEGAFEWTSGEPANFASWGAGEPDGALLNKDCAFQYTSKFKGSWDDFQCMTSAHYVCER